MIQSSQVNDAHRWKWKCPGVYRCRHNICQTCTFVNLGNMHEFVCNEQYFPHDESTTQILWVTAVWKACVAPSHLCDLWVFVPAWRHVCIYGLQYLREATIKAVQSGEGGAYTKTETSVHLRGRVIFFLRLTAALWKSCSFITLPDLTVAANATKYEKLTKNNFMLEKQNNGWIWEREICNDEWKTEINAQKQKSSFE